MQSLAMLIKYFYEWGFVVKFEKVYKKFFEKGNKDNITPQSPESNRVHQLHFEQEVNNYLKGTKKSGSEKDVDERKVYYEIEEISDIDSNILGRRIYIYWFDDKKNNIHVFIPEEPMNISH